MARGLILALEDGDDVVETSVVEEVPAEVESGVAETVEAGGEVAENVETIDAAVNDAEDLQGVHDVMADSVADDGEGLDETAAEVAEVAVESICRRLGFSHGNMPKMESFGSKNSRVAATKLAMEGLVDKLKQVWEAIKAFFQRALEAVKNFFGKFFATNDSIIKTADALAARVRDLPGGNTPESKTFSNGSVADAFSLDNKAASFAQAKAVLATHEELSKNALETIVTLSQAAAATSTAIGSMVKEAKDLGATDKSVAAFKKTSAAEITAFLAEAKKVSGSKTKTEKDGTEIVTSPGIVGNKKMEHRGNPAKLVVGFDIVNGTKTGGASKEVPVLSTSEMTELIDLSKDLAITNKKYQGNYAKIEGIFKSATKAADEVLASLHGATNESRDKQMKNAAETFSSARRLLSAQVAIASRAATGVPSLNVQAAKSALNYVSASLGQYKAKKAK